MNEINRIKKDISMFEKNIDKLDDETIINQEILKLAKQYYWDSKYYLEKKDYFTAFGCINYGHGLLDALLIIRGLKED